MSSSYNPYADCPCGSGKKVKFCCTEIADEIARVARLGENHQMEQVRLALEALLKKPLSNPWTRVWVKSTLASVLNYDDPRQSQLVDESLRDVPDHPRASHLRALLDLDAKQYPAARASIEHAFRCAHDSSRRGLALLADVLAYLFLNAEQWFAAARHFHLALMLDPNRERAAGVARFLGSSAPFPARSLIPPRSLPDNRTSPEFDGACKGLVVGAEHMSAVRFEEMTRKMPERPEPWFNAGLGYASCGEAADAARAFREAARREPDFERAVDDETLAQIVEIPLLPKEDASIDTWPVDDVSELLSRLDAAPRWVRLEGQSPAFYEILDRDPPPHPTFETAARCIATVTVADDARNAPPELQLRCGVRADRDALLNQVRELGGPSLRGEPVHETVAVGPREYSPLHLDLSLGDTVGIAEQRAVHRAAHHHLVDHVWPQLKLTALKGKTPLEAAGDSTLKVALAAAVVVFESHCLEDDYPFDRDAVRGRVGLPPCEYFDKDESESARSFSLLDLTRLSLSSVGDDELLTLMEFVQLSDHAPLRERIAGEILSRSELMKKIDPPQVYRLMARCCHQRFAREEALAWIGRARRELQSGAGGKDEFEQRFQMDVEEIRVREDDPQDPQLAVLAARVWSMAQKVPEVRDQVAALLKSLGLSGPWTLASAAGATSPELVSSGLWTPDSAQPPAAGGLWVPES